MSGDDIEALVVDLPQGDHPEWMAPTLAVLTDERFSNPDWIYERKLDGERLWPAAGFVDTGLGLHSSVLERHGA